MSEGSTGVSVKHVVCSTRKKEFSCYSTTLYLQTMKSKTFSKIICCAFITQPKCDKLHNMYSVPQYTAMSFSVLLYKHYLRHTFGLPSIEKPPTLDRCDVGREILLFDEFQVRLGFHSNACQLVQEGL